MAKSRVIYKPEGGSRRAWEMDPENPPWDVMFNTEKETGWPWGEFAEKLSKGSAIALRALIFTLRKRDEPRLTIDAVTITLDEVDFEDIEDDSSTQGPPDPEA